MITKSIYNDVELEVEVCTETKVTSSIGKFSNTSIKIHEVKIAGDKIEEGLACLSEACGYNLTAKQMLEIVFKNDNLIGWVAAGSFDSMTRNFFCDLFTEHLVGKPCPRGGDSREYVENFFKEVNAAAKELGYVKLDV